MKAAADRIKKRSVASCGYLTIEHRVLINMPVTSENDILPRLNKPIAKTALSEKLSSYLVNDIELYRYSKATQKFLASLIKDAINHFILKFSAHLNDHI